MNFVNLLASGDGVVNSLESFKSSVITLGEMGWELSGQAMDFVVDNPICLAFLAIPLVGLGIGYIKRLIG